MRNLFILISLFLTSQGCISQSNNAVYLDYKTQKVIVIVMDGPRYSETWGDTSHKYIPKMAKEMAKTGVIFTNFNNDGFTYTTSGHTAICTGNKQELENAKGSQLPDYPSFLQYYLKSKNLPSSKGYIITTKDKLEILSNCNNSEFYNKNRPNTNCGNSGLGSGYTNDHTTFERTIEVLKNEKPNVMLVNFKEPDASGHANNWEGYINGIKDVDSLIWEVWKFIQTDEYYKGTTTLFVTNDHGRHLDGHKDGFVSHGDDCEGCRHINLFAMGPDFKANSFENGYFTQVDVTATIAELLGFKMPFCQGKVIKPLFN